MVVRVVDSASPPHAVLGAGVQFQSYTGLQPGNEPHIRIGEAGMGYIGMPILLAISQTTVLSDSNGLASFPLSTGVSGNIAVIGSATVEGASVLFTGQQLAP